MADAGHFSARTAVTRLVTTIVILTGVFSVLSFLLNPASLRTDALRFVAIALVGVLVARGFRWARLLLLLLTGFAALLAVVVAIRSPMSLVWRLVLFSYGAGTLACLWRLYRDPAASFFYEAFSGAKGGA